jgi:hypothetical protein
MSNAKILELKSAYERHGTIVGVSRETGCNSKTVKKYLYDILIKKVAPTDVAVAAIYSLNGTLGGTASALGISKTTTWRRLQKMGIHVGGGSRDSRRLYQTLRKRVTDSEWRASILQRDRYRCVMCGVPSKVVHHKKKLSIIRDEVFLRTGINPFESFQNLRRFTDSVMKAHDGVDGETLCNRCHERVHSSQ